MKKVAIILVVVLLLGLGGGLGYTIYTSNQKEAEYIAQAEEQQFLIDDLQWQVDELGKTVTVYGLAYDVRSGTEAYATDLVATEVPAGIADAYVKDPSEIVGKYYLLDYDSGTLLTTQMVYGVELKSDNRILDVMCDRQPVGFEAGDIVDVRISFPDGQDYLLLHKKLVEDVYGNAMRLVVDEKDILIYKSAEADWGRFIKNGRAGISVQIYCTLYVEAGIQSADRYYPVQTVLPDGVTFEGSVLWVAAQDENLVKSDADLSDWLVIDRLTFEKSMIQFDVYRSREYDDEKQEYYYEVDIEGGARIVNDSKEIRNNQYETAISIFERREEERARLEAEAAEAAKNNQ